MGIKVKSFRGNQTLALGLTNIYSLLGSTTITKRKT